MRHPVRLAVALAAAIVGSGCLQKDASHTLYISPDDQVTWVSIEADVHSGASDPIERFGEERDYLAAVAIGRHPIATALQALAPEAVVRTQLLRDERPFRVQTDARVGPIDRVLQRLFDSTGVQASVRLTRDGPRATLSVLLDFAIARPEVDGPVSVLLEELDAYKLVLTEGEFTAASGWDYSGAAALLSKSWLEEVDGARRAKGRAQLTVSWEVR